MGFRFPRVQCSTNLSSVSTLYSQDSYSDPPIQNRKPSILEMMSMHESKQQQPSILDMMRRESKQQSQNLTDSQLHHDCPNNTSSFQVQSQNDAPIDDEKMLEAMTQDRLARDHEIDMMVQSLRSHRSAISDIANHSVRADELRCFGQQDLIQYHHLNLPKLQFLIVWQVFPFLK